MWAAACVSPEERAAIESVAAGAGLTVSDLIRRSVSRAAGMTPPECRLDLLADVRDALDVAGRAANESMRNANTFAPAVETRGTCQRMLINEHQA